MKVPGSIPSATNKIKEIHKVFKNIILDIERKANKERLKFWFRTSSLPSWCGGSPGVSVLLLQLFRLSVLGWVPAVLCWLPDWSSALNPSGPCTRSPLALESGPGSAERGHVTRGTGQPLRQPARRGPGAELSLLATAGEWALETE